MCIDAQWRHTILSSVALMSVSAPQLTETSHRYPLSLSSSSQRRLFPHLAVRTPTGSPPHPSPSIGSRCWEPGSDVHIWSSDVEAGRCVRAFVCDGIRKGIFFFFFLRRGSTRIATQERC